MGVVAVHILLNSIYLVYICMKLGIYGTIGLMIFSSDSSFLM